MIRRVLEAISEKEFTPRKDVVEPEESGGFKWGAVAQVFNSYGFEISKVDPPDNPKHPGRSWVTMANPGYQNVEAVVSVETDAITSPWGADDVEYVIIDANGQSQYKSGSMDALAHHLKIVNAAFMGGGEKVVGHPLNPPYTVSLQWLWGDEDQMKDLGPFDTYKGAVQSADLWKKGIEKNLKQVGAVTVTIVDGNGNEVVHGLGESVLEKEFTPRADVVEPEGGGKKTSALHDFLVGQGWELSDFGIGKDDDEASNYYTHPGVAGPNGVAWISLRDKGHFDDDAEWVAGDEFVGASGSDGGLLGHGGDEVELAYDDVIPFAKKVVAAAEDPVPAPGLGDLVMGLVKGWGVEKAWKGVVAAVAEKDWLSTNESGQPPSNENPMNIYPVATGKMLNVLKKTAAQQKEEIAKVLAKLKLPSEWDGGIEAFRVWPSPDVPDEDNAQTFGMLIDVLGKHVYGE